jgi:hypothetical protein
VLQPQHRFPAFVMIAGALILLAAIALGQRMGDRVLGEATERTLSAVPPIVISPAPAATGAAYGPDWKRSETLSAPPDPHFPDPRVPPKPLPTPPPPPTPSPTPIPTTSINPNLPIWRQQPFPTMAPSELPSGSPAPAGSSAPLAARPSPTPP